MRGTIDVEGGRIDPASCLVRIVPIEGAADPKGRVYQGDPSLIVRTVGRDGIFRVENVAAGTWAVEVRQPGYAPALVSPVSVAPGGSSLLLGPVVLRRVFDLELTVLPRLDLEGNPWSVHAGREDSLTDHGGRRDLLPQPVEEGSGVFRAPLQRAGRYWISIDGAATIYDRSNVEIQNAADAHRTIDLRGLAIEGEVRSGGKPVSSFLQFRSAEGGEYGFAGSDEDGKLAGHLPGGEGMWQVQARRDEKDLPTFLTVDVREDRPGHATFDLELPATRLFGRVVDDNGVPQPKVSLQLEAVGVETKFYENDTSMAGTGFNKSEERPIRFVELNEQGEFDLDGPPPGKLLLRPVRPFPGDFPISAAGEAMVIEVLSGRETGPITVRVPTPRSIRGTVRKDGEAAPAGLRLGFSDGSETETFGTDEEGNFELELPGDLARGGSSEKVTLALLPAEGALRVLEYPLLESGRPLSIEVENIAGEVRIELPETWYEESGTLRAFELEQDGVALPDFAILDWVYQQGQQARNFGSTQTVPALPAGHYRACLGPAGLGGRIDRATRRGSVVCAEGDLERGRDLRLDLRR